MIAEIPFVIPAAFEAGLKSGEFIRYGSIIKNAATGHIASHLQEAGLAQSLMSLGSLGAAASPQVMAVKVVSEVVNAGAGVYNAVQINQLIALVQGLQTLQIATLGVSLVGVGVSVAGFAYMHRRFNAVDKKIDKLMDALETGFKDQQKANLRSHLSQVTGLLKQATQAHTLSNPDKEYSRIAEHLASEAAHFEGELEFVIKVSGRINPDLFWQLAQTLMTCNSARIDCRLRTNELRNALEVSQGVAASYQNIFGRITPISFDASPTESLSTVNTLKEITDAAATKPYLIDYLHSRRIDGPAYLGCLENETMHPLLMLNVS